MTRPKTRAQHVSIGKHGRGRPAPTNLRGALAAAWRSMPRHAVESNSSMLNVTLLNKEAGNPPRSGGGRIGGEPKVRL